MKFTHLPNTVLSLLLLYLALSLFWSTQTGHFLQRTFIVNRRLITVLSMQPFKVVIPHVSRDIFCHKLTRWLLNFKYPVMFQTAKKTFNHCIISASSDIAHIGAYTVTFKQLTIAPAGVLRSTITVKHQSFGWSPQVVSLYHGLANKPTHGSSQV
jgi:hypothetical protein